MPDLIEHAMIRARVRVTHERPMPDGSLALLMEHESENLRTTAGFQAFADWLSGCNGTGDNGTATGVASTTLTDTGKAWTTNAQAGRRVIAAAAAALVYANITNNTGTVLTHDGWKKFTDNTAATAPTGTPQYAISLRSPSVYIALSTDAGAPAAGDTSLASEVTAAGLARVLATTNSYNTGTKVLTIGNVFTAGASVNVTGVQKASLTDSSVNGTGTLINENTFPSVNLITGDVFTTTWSLTLS